jgi:hypothetical protein
VRFAKAGGLGVGIEDETRRYVAILAPTQPATERHM